MSEEIKRDNNEQQQQTKSQVETDATETTTPGEAEKKPVKTFTEDELNEIIKKRLERERKKYEGFDEIKAEYERLKKAEEERKQAEMTELERLQAKLAELEKQAQEAEQAKSQALEAANKRLIKSEFRLIAKELGVRSEALDDAFVLADLSAVEVDEDGNVKGVKEAVEALKKAKPYLFGGNEYADPTPGNNETKRADSKESMKRKLQELAEKARKSGRIEDKIAYVKLKNELGL
jgi:hypothetical protein